MQHDETPPRAPRRQRPTRRAVLGILAVLLVVGCVALWRALRFDAPEEFWRQKGELRDVQVERLEGDSLYQAYHVQLSSSAGYSLRGHLRVPRTPGTWPAIIVIGGVNTGRMAAELITPDEPYVVLGLDYPWEGSTRLTPLQFLVRLLAIRDAMLLTPSAIFLAIDYIQTHPSVDESGPVLVGASFGAQLITVAGALDERAGPVLAIYGGGDFAELLRGNLEFRPQWLRSAVANAGAWLLEPVEPTKYVARIAPRPFVMINGTQDTRIPEASVLALYEEAREPKRLIWLDEGHISSRRPAMLERVLDAAADALVQLRGEAGSPQTSAEGAAEEKEAAIP